MSTTNAATDQLLVAVDRALEDVGAAKGARISLRERCKRIGQRFIASNYVGREHLLPVTNDSLVNQLAELQANVPLKTDTEDFAKWRAEEESLREQIKRQSMGALDSASLAAMTTTRAAFGLVLLGISWEGPELTGNFGVRQSVFFESAGYGISIAALSSNGWFERGL
ncbi:MAG: hypothetical protein ACK526_23390, partial [Planctomyces sp.]